MKIEDYIKFIYVLHVLEEHAMAHMCESEADSYDSDVLSSILWVSKLKFRSSGVVVRASIHWTTSQGHALCLNENREIFGLWNNHPQEMALG